MNVYLYQNNTEKEVQNIYIGEYTGYKPGANTIAYYPLSSNANDYSGNGYDLTATGTVTYSSQGATVDGSYLSRGTTALLPTGTNNRTTSLWTYATATSNQGTLLYYGTSSSGQTWWLSLDSNGDLGFTGYGSSYNSGKYNISRNTRYNIVAIYTSNTVYVYVNGVLVITYSKSLNTGNSYIYIGKDPQYDTYYRGKISEVIIENKAWSAQEISDYYNQTKSNYGL